VVKGGGETEKLRTDVGDKGGKIKVTLPQEAPFVTRSQHHQAFWWIKRSLGQKKKNWKVIGGGAVPLHKEWGNFDAKKRVK